MRKRVLILEDDVDAARLMQMALADEGYELVTASDAEVALGECVARDPDVILLDLLLGETDGKTFLKKYRRWASAHARVVAVSGLTDSHPLVKGLVVDEFIGKPFDVEHLSNTVRRLAFA